MSTFHLILLFIGTHAAAFAIGVLFDRNNPNLSAVNKLIAAGKAGVDAAGKVFKK